MSTFANKASTNAETLVGLQYYLQEIIKRKQGWSVKWLEMIKTFGNESRMPPSLLQQTLHEKQVLDTYYEQTNTQIKQLEQIMTPEEKKEQKKLEDIENKILDDIKKKPTYQDEKDDMEKQQFNTVLLYGAGIVLVLFILLK